MKEHIQTLVVCITIMVVVGLMTRCELGVQKSKDEVTATAVSNNCSQVMEVGSRLWKCTE